MTLIGPATITEIWLRKKSGYRRKQWGMGGPHIGAHITLPGWISSSFLSSKSFTGALYTMTPDVSANGVAAVFAHSINVVTRKSFLCSFHHGPQLITSSMHDRSVMSPAPRILNRVRRYGLTLINIMLLKQGCATLTLEPLILGLLFSIWSLDLLGG